MDYKYQYITENDKSKLITDHADKFLVEEQAIFVDNTYKTKNFYLVFSDNKPSVREIQIPVENSDLLSLKDSINMILLKQEGII